MNQREAYEWMEEHFPPKKSDVPDGWHHKMIPQWSVRTNHTITSYSARKWIHANLTRAMENPEDKGRCFREALRLRRALTLGLYRVNMWDGSGRSYPVIPGIPLGHEWQYDRSDAR